MKDLLVCGVDDGYFPLSYKGRRGKTVLLSVMMSEYKLVDVNFSFITIDGDDCTDALIQITPECNVILLDGVIFGGFNYISVDDIKNGRYIIFYSHKPNLTEILRALNKHFSYDEKRINSIVNVLSNLVKLPTKRGEVFIYSNLDKVLVKLLIEKYQLFSKIPYPLSVSHELASSLSRFLLTSF
jgi:endonuclease V-like protein UPF0215 family